MTVRLMFTTGNNLNSICDKISIAFFTIIALLLYLEYYIIYWYSTLDVKLR